MSTTNPDTISVFFTEDEFEEVLNVASTSASSDEEEEFINAIKARYSVYKMSAHLSIEEKKRLLRIVDYYGF